MSTKKLLVKKGNIIPYWMRPNPLRIKNKSNTNENKTNGVL